MTEIADIFRVHVQDYLSSHGKPLLSSQYQAIGDIIACRSGVLGGHLMACEKCGHTQYSYHSCCNRSCPKCLGKNSEKWVEERRKELLPSTYFHVVFTIPKELRWIVMRHQKVLYGILFQAAAKTLNKLGQDPHYIGGDIGFYAVLHTWTRALLFHPHLHCLIPGCGIDSDGKWIPGRKNYLFPYKPLADIFRATFMKMARKALPDISFPQAVWTPKWVVHIKPSIQGPEKVVKYLGRYIHRVAITNNRIQGLDNGKVVFKYRDNQENRWKTMTLPAAQFINRFLQHVLPKGFHKVRTYGFLHPTQRNRLQTARNAECKEPSPQTASVHQKVSSSKLNRVSFTLPCQNCSDGILRITGFIPPSIKYQFKCPRAPP
jgi:hypothetical protein